MARRSLSFGSGATESGGCFTNPGAGGAVTAGDAPPPPTASACGPKRGGASALGEPKAAGEGAAWTPVLGNAEAGRADAAGGAAVTVPGTPEKS